MRGQLFLEGYLSTKKIGVIFIWLAVISGFVIGCNVDPLQDNMWSDVPVYRYAAFSSYIDSAISFPEQKSNTQEIDYLTDKQPADVVAFYTDDLMKQHDWVSNNPGGSQACDQFIYDGQARAMCYFKKTGKNGSGIDLLIDVRPDLTSGKTLIIYMRMTYV
jgi:hypothetical protein